MKMYNSVLSLTRMITGISVMTLIIVSMLLFVACCSHPVDQNNDRLVPAVKTMVTVVT